MKKSILVLNAVVALTMVGCKESPYINAPGDNRFNTDSIPVVVDPQPTPDPEGVNIPAGTITVNEAVNIGKKLQVSNKDNKFPSETAYYIKGWVDHFDEKERGKSDFEDKFAQYGNDYVYLKACNDGRGTKEFYCYRVLGRGGAKLPSHDVLQIGDFVVVKCKILNFGGTIENEGTCSIEVSNNAAYNEAFPIPDTIRATCAQAKDSALALPNGGSSKDIYVVEGYVQSAGYSSEISKGQQKWFWIDDKPSGSKVLEAYWCNVPDGTTPVAVGAKIRLTGFLLNYNGNTAEIKNGDIEILETPAE